MKIVGVIPARYHSTRFAGKMLADLNGKPLIQHVWERARRSKRLNQVLIACDSERIMEAAKKFKAKAVLTSVHHQSGTDRIAEAVKHLKVDIVINIQGDEPLIHPSTIDSLADSLIKDKSAVMATVVKVIEQKDELDDPNVVKVVLDRNRNALYFSRSAIPYNREKQDFNKSKYLKHLGIYAYRKNFLMKLRDLPVSALEKMERLEQLRVLEAGYKIKTILTKRETIGVDTPEDLIKVREILKSKR